MIFIKHYLAHNLDSSRKILNIAKEIGENNIPIRDKLIEISSTMTDNTNNFKEQFIHYIDLIIK